VIDLALIPEQVQQQNSFSLDMSVVCNVPHNRVFVGVAHSHPHSDPSPTAIDQHNHKLGTEMFGDYFSLICAHNNSTGENTRAIVLTAAGVRAVGACKKSAFHDDHAQCGAHWQYSSRFRIVDQSTPQLVGEIRDLRK
jgi:hypothetical protein